MRRMIMKCAATYLTGLRTQEVFVKVMESDMGLMRDLLLLVNTRAP